MDRGADADEPMILDVRGLRDWREPAGTGQRVAIDDEIVARVEAGADLRVVEGVEPL